jgi:hypothetical protein
MDMFRQIAPHGIVNKQVITDKAPTDLIDDTAEQQPTPPTTIAREPTLAPVNSDIPDATTSSMQLPVLETLTTDEVTHPKEYPHPHDTEEALQPKAGEAVAVAPNSEETVLTHKEMSEITPAECPFLMNKE